MHAVGPQDGLTVGLNGDTAVAFVMARSRLGEGFGDCGVTHNWEFANFVRMERHGFANAKSARAKAVSPRLLRKLMGESLLDRKSTRLNSSHVAISYAVFCL